MLLEEKIVKPNSIFLLLTFGGVGELFPTNCPLFFLFFFFCLRDWASFCRLKAISFFFFFFLFFFFFFFFFLFSSLFSLLSSLSFFLSFFSFLFFSFLFCSFLISYFLSLISYLLFLISYFFISYFLFSFNPHSLFSTPPSQVFSKNKQSCPLPLFGIPSFVARSFLVCFKRIPSHTPTPPLPYHTLQMLFRGLFFFLLPLFHQKQEGGEVVYLGFGCFSSSVGGFLCFFEMTISGLGEGEDPHQDQERPGGGGLPLRPGGGPFSAQEERRPRRRSGSTTKARRSARRRGYFYVSLSFPSLPISFSDSSFLFVSLVYLISEREALRRSKKLLFLPFHFPS